jgi:iron complex transport system substrate-binding protein
MRIVSLVPAATEIAIALGASRSLVAVTHDDDHPAVAPLPRVTRSTIPVDATAREIDGMVRQAGVRGESTFHLDEAAFRDAAPDLVLGQTLCAVCALTLDAIPSTLPRSPRIVPLKAESLAGMLDDVRRVGAALGREREATRLVTDLEARMRGIAERVAGRPRPRVACIEWLDPPFNGGHWVPEQVAIAGGVDVLGTPGARSREITWDDVRTARPDVLLAMPCGWDADRAAREAETVPLRDETRIVAVDGAAYFSRPGPRLVDGIELLASIFHRGAVAPPDGALSVEVSLPA